MAQISESLSDYTVVTNDNPRCENEDKILSDIISGFKNINSFITIKNREEAIYHAINIAGSDGVVAIVGKGGEKYSIIGEKYLPYSDKDAAKKALEKIKSKGSTKDENQA